MQTTGTVLLNARGCNINGYDCFVNLSKFSKNEQSFHNTGHWIDPNVGDPISGFPTYTKMGSESKFSVSTFECSNVNGIYIYYSSNSSSTFSSAASYTVSMWSKRTMLTSGGSSSLRGRFYVGTSCHTIDSYGFNTNKYSQATNSSGSNVKQNHSVEFTNSIWHHFASVKNGNRFLLFVDGVKIFDSSQSWRVETYNRDFIVLTSLYQTTYYDDIVVIMNEALWTSNFTPPSTYLLDSEYAMDLSDVKRRNIIAANVDKKLIIPDEPLKQY